MNVSNVAAQVTLPRTATVRETDVTITEVVTVEAIVITDGHVQEVDHPTEEVEETEVEVEVAMMDAQKNNAKVFVSFVDRRVILKETVLKKTIEVGLGMVEEMSFVRLDDTEMILVHHRQDAADRLPDDETPPTEEETTLAKDHHQEEMHAHQSTGMAEAEEEETAEAQATLAERSGDQAAKKEVAIQHN